MLIITSKFDRLWAVHRKGSKILFQYYIYRLFMIIFPVLRFCIVVSRTWLNKSLIQVKASTIGKTSNLIVYGAACRKRGKILFQSSIYRLFMISDDAWIFSHQLTVAQLMEVVDTCKIEEERRESKNFSEWIPEGSLRCLSQQKICHIKRDLS